MKRSLSLSILIMKELPTVLKFHNKMATKTNLFLMELYRHLPLNLFKAQVIEIKIESERESEIDR